MFRFILSFFLALFIILSFSQEKLSNDHATHLKAYSEAEKIFQKAEDLAEKADADESLQANADSTYKKALTAFNSLLSSLDKTGYDSLSFFTKLKTGFIAYYLGDASTAKSNYLSAIQLKTKLPLIPDSALFIPLIYTGGIYHDQNQFDSALYFYKNAEQISNRYDKPLNESQRLYNRLGAMFYENGNYQQARNYFEKAIELLTATGSADNGLLANYKINIASLHVKLEEYDKAKLLYENLLSSDIFLDEINHNLGIIGLKQQQFKNAIEYFRKVNYKNSSKIIDLYYNMAVAWTGLQEKDSSAFYLQLALAENIKWNGHKKNIPYGLILRYQADELVKQKEYKKAAEKLQEAIIQFDASFNETDVNKNPEEFSAVFSYINLFNALTAKADAMKMMYEEEKNTTVLEASLDAYRSAFSLTDYVEKTYNSDEARLFLNKIKYTAHSKPIDISLLLYELTLKKEYLDAAYTFDQQNKASILALNVRESELRKTNTSSRQLLEEETSVKTAITRQLMKLSRTSDSQQAAAIHSSIRDDEIRLGKLQEQIKTDPTYRTGYFITQIPPVADLQKKLDEKTAVLSYHFSDDEMVVIFITGNNFDYLKASVNQEFFNNADSLKTSLHSAFPDSRYTGSSVAKTMYEHLISPVEEKLKNIKRLVIIPDDELNYLPFEALQDKSGKYLIEKFSVQYQYSTSLWGDDKDRKEKKSTEILAFAPFASAGFKDLSGSYFSPLPASKEETGNLKGNILKDSLADKRNFLSLANHYGIIHLATHASADNEEPLRSYIAFYPSKNNNTDDYKLYAPEIYDMNLDSTQLIVLSACETGAGQLIRGEGLMSLSRAFAYAGCPNIITSLWKAEDKTTAFITQRLHHYLEKGLPKDKALQQAKLDLLQTDEIDPRFKTPNYWAHLIFIGNYEPIPSRNSWWWIAVGIIIAAIIYRSIKPKNLPEKGRQV